VVLERRRLDLLHLFAVHGTIAGAAAASGYSASAVSQQLAVLEREAGVALLERSARSAALTREIDVAIVDTWTEDSPTENGIDRRVLLNDPLVLAGAVNEGLWLSAPTDQPSRAATDAILARLRIKPRLQWAFEGLAMIAGLDAGGTRRRVSGSAARVERRRLGQPLPSGALGVAELLRYDDLELGVQVASRSTRVRQASSAQPQPPARG